MAHLHGFSSIIKVLIAGTLEHCYTTPQAIKLQPSQEDPLSRQQTFPLLALPRELREQIYFWSGYPLVDFCVHFCDEDCSCALYQLFMGCKQLDTIRLVFRVGIEVKTEGLNYWDGLDPIEDTCELEDSEVSTVLDDVAAGEHRLYETMEWLCMHIGM
jgi:hypothetical protein